jgi:hypothetical protein
MFDVPSTPIVVCMSSDDPELIADDEMSQPGAFLRLPLHILLPVLGSIAPRSSWSQSDSSSFSMKSPVHWIPDQSTTLRVEFFLHW